MNKTIYLASQSHGRQQLLSEAQIPFTLIQQSADEQACDWNQSLPDVVTSIAVHKMKHAIIPAGSKNISECVVLTADTLVQSAKGVICGKSESLEHAKKILRELQGTVFVATAFCLKSFEWNNNQWVTKTEHVQVVTSTLEFEMSDADIDKYIHTIDVLKIAGALQVEGYGSQFIKSVKGSYTNIIGLPMFELVKSLQILE